MNNTARTVRQRILAMALLPGIFIFAVMSSLYLWARFSDLDHHLMEEAKNNSNIIAAFINVAFQDNDLHQVQKLMTLALEDNDVRAVSLLNADGYRLMHAGPSLYQVTEYQHFPAQKAIIAGKKSLLASIPLYTTEDDLSQLSGWLQIEYTYAQVNLDKYKSLLLSLLLAVLALSFGVLFCLRLSNSIITPLQAMIASLDAISNGQTRQRLEADSSSMLYEIESSINRMLDNIDQTSQAMRQNVEETAEELQETLETIEIQNVELDLARKEALEASRSKSEFLANMSHEIRTPLNGITGYTSLMLESELKPQQREHLRTIEKSAQGLLSMLNDILDFSRLEAGKLQLDNSRFMLHTTVDDVLAIMAPAAHGKSLELVSFIYDDIPAEIIGDKQRLTQILTNLVSNAVKFTSYGSVAVRVMLEQEHENGQITLKFTVTDTGTGLPREQQQRLFKAFSQADTSRNRQSGGTGLGLAISKSLVEQMQGEIGLDSDLGRGACFWFTITTHPVPGDKCHVYKAALPRRTVILYEPLELSRLSITHLLESLNCSVTPLHSRQEIQKHLHQDSYDLMILSQEEHDLDNILTIASDIAQNLPVIVLTRTRPAAEYPETLPDQVSTLSTPVARQRLVERLRDQDLGLDSVPETSMEPGTFQHQQTILAVDDNLVNLKLLKTMLENMGQTVMTAGSGYEALRWCEKVPFDLILMDVRMPGMDGIEATQKIRALPNIEKNLPVIAITAHALPDEKKLILTSGFNDYMTKPVNIRQLATLISQWTNNPLKPRHKCSNVLFSSNIAESPVDLQRSIQLAGGNEDLAREMREMLLQELEDDLASIDQNIARDNHKGLLERVHRLHGASRYCGVPRLQHCCYELENLLKHQELLSDKTIQNSIKELKQAISQLQAWYKQEAVSAG